MVIADEAHRSQDDFIGGFAKHMRNALPKASFIGFTGTPIESGDKNTQAVFGDSDSVGCGCTVSAMSSAVAPISSASIATVINSPAQRQ
jgi:superfamily II DNA or RNA helicase